MTGQELRQLRRALKLSQRKMASIIGGSVATLQEWSDSWADVPGILSFRSLQVAAIRTGGDPPGSGLVPAFLLVVPRRGGIARRAGRARRPRHRLEVGAALRPGNGTPIATAAPTDQRQLAGRL